MGELNPLVTHTPGPWKFVRGEFNGNGNGAVGSIESPGDDDYYIAEVWSDFEAEDESDVRDGSPPAGTGEANGRLLAAAPDLLDAVRMILRGFDEGVFVRDVSHDMDPTWAIRLFPFIRALSKAVEAIEKVEGSAAPAAVREGP